MGVFALLSTDMLYAQCSTGLYYADMDRNQQANFLGSAVTDVEYEANIDPACPGTRMLKLAIDIPEACSRAVIWIQFQGEPSGWTVDLGDSSTNNGFGGDAGTTPHNAELQILDQNLAVYNAADVPEEVDRLAFQQLRLTDGAVNLVVENQFVGWSQPYSELQSTGLERLFAIPDDQGDGRRIYLGVNRVIANTSRTGCGARRVLISFD